MLRRLAASASACAAFAHEGVDDGDQEILDTVRQEAQPLVQHAIVDLAEDVLEILIEPSPQNGTDQRADTAQDRHDHDLARSGPVHPFGPGQRVHRRQQAWFDLTARSIMPKGERKMRIEI